MARRIMHSMDMEFGLGTSFFALIVAVWGAGQAPVAAGPPPEHPNIVLIFTDDQGYADVGCFGADGFDTPHLDELANQGLRFTNWYVAQAVCSASRIALLTGCYPNRVGILGALGPRSQIGIHADETTIAEICKSQGYATAMFGKWHLGDQPPFLPTRHGFDQYFGLPYSNDMWPLHPDYVDLPPAASKRKQGYPPLPLWENEQIIDPEVTAEDQAQLTTWYTERAVKFIDENAARPFFVYLAHSMPHVPLFVSEKCRGKSRRGLYGDVIMEIDWSVGQMIKALKDHDLTRRTLVIFTSDNGPWISYGEHAGSARPLREAKGTTFEGGCRTPCIMSWPGTIPAGAECDKIAATIDLLPTVCDLLEAPLPPLPIDGRSIRCLIEGRPGAESPHEAYYFYDGKQLQAIRSGRWKLHFPHAYRTLNGRIGGKGGRPVPYEQARIGCQLFDLQEDIGETTDVSAEHPDVVALLSALAEGMRARLGDGDREGSEVRLPGRR